MNAIDELIQKVADEAERQQVQAKTMLNEIYGVGMGKIEETLQEALGESWQDELEAGTPWERFVTGNVVRESSRDITVAMSATVNLVVDAKHLGLAGMRLAVLVKSLQDGGYRMGAVVARVMDDPMQEYALPGEFSALLVHARKMWKSMRIKALREWFGEGARKRFLKTVNVDLEATVVGSKEWTKAKERVDKAELVLNIDGEEMARDLRELSPEVSWDGLLDYWRKDVEVQAQDFRGKMEWMERKPGLLEEYRQACERYAAEWQEAKEHNEKLLLEVKEALDLPFEVWLLTYGVRIGGNDWWPEKAWSVAPEADEEGYWPVVDACEVVRTMIPYVATMKVGMTVRPSEGHATVASEYSHVFDAYVPFGPGMREEAVGLIRAAEAEARVYPEAPKEPEGRWLWDELEEVRRKVINR